MLGRCSLTVILLILTASTAQAGLVYYVADGNNSGPNNWENHLIKYTDGAISTVLIQDPNASPGNEIYGFPGDFQRVGSTVYGIDTGRRSLYTIDMNTGYVSPINTNNITGMSGLAYNPASTTMYVVNKDPVPIGGGLTENRLYTLNVTNAVPTTLLNSPLLDDVRGLAFNTADGHLYAHSRGSGDLLKINPTTQAITPIHNLVSGSGADNFFSELQFFGGQLYGTWVNGTAAANTQVQLRRIDLASGIMTDIGSPISGVSAHSLLIVSIPEPSMVPIFLALSGSVVGLGAARTRWRRAASV